MIKQPQIEKTLVLSTAHISQEEIKKLDTNPDSYPSTVIYHPSGYGTILHVPDEAWDFSACSEDLVKIINEARRLECSWVNFDRDGETYPELKTFEW